MGDDDAMPDPSPDPVLNGVILALEKSPGMVSEEGDPDLHKGHVQRYNRWVKEVRNPCLFEGAARDHWFAVQWAREELSCFRRLKDNLKPFENVDLYGGDNVEIIIRRKDGKSEAIDGNWLNHAAVTLL